MNSIITISLPSLNRLELLKKAVENVRNDISVPKDIISFYSDKDIDTRDWLLQQKDIISKPDNGMGLTKIHNYLNKTVNTKYIVYWADDLYFYPGTFERGIKYLKEHSNEKILAVAFCFQMNGRDNEPYTYSTIQYRGEWKPFMSFGIVNLKSLRDIGCWDERYYNYPADIDFQLKGYENGYKIVPLTDTRVKHYNIKDSTKKAARDSLNEGQILFDKKWKGISHVTHGVGGTYR